MNIKDAPKDYLEKLYIQQELSLKDIGEIFVCTSMTVSKYLRIHNISIRKSYPNIDLTGKTFGKLYLEEKIVEGTKITYKCICSCGKQVIRRFYCTNNFSDKSSCGKCGYYKDITTQFWGKVIIGATERNISFNITKEYVWEVYESQNRKCIYSGFPLSFASNWKKNTCSIDRIDSTKGYEIGNIQIVHKVVNLLKNATNDKLFIYLCKTIAENKKDVDVSEFKNKKIFMIKNTITSE